MLEGLAGLAGSALAGDRDGRDAELVQAGLDAGFAVAAVGGDRSGSAPGLPRSTVWSGTIPSSLSMTWAL